MASRVARWFLRTIKHGAVLIAVAPFLVLTKLTKYVYVSQFIGMIPLRFGEQVRYEFYRRTLASCGKDVTIGFGSVLSYPDITIGNHVWMDSYCNIGHADIQDYVLVARNCHFVSGAHAHPFNRTDIPIMRQQGRFERVCVGPDVWIGSGAIILADIHQGCVVGAGSVVTRPVPPMSVAVGSPARVIRQRTPESSPIESTEGEYPSVGS